ncbi:MAG TPA: hypothetical protein VGK48_18175 [Terriglobia bacterium]
MALRTVLIDTGPLVAYLDNNDVDHKTIASIVGAFRGTLCSTSAVITEAMHLLKDDPRGPRLLAEFIQAAGVQVFESTQPQQLLSAVSLMEKYSDTPMDFADATLVQLAGELGTHRIITMDRRGFRTFRTPRGQAFEILQ